MKNSRIVLVAVGALLVVVCAALLVKQSHATREARRSGVAAHHAAVARCLELGQEMNQRIQAARKAGMSRMEFGKQFGEVSACSQQTETEVPPDATHVYAHEPSHRVFYLRFDGDVLVGVSSRHGPDDIQPHLPSLEQRIAEME